METHRDSLAVWRKLGKLVGLGSPREFESPTQRFSLQDESGKKRKFNNDCINTKIFHIFSENIV